MKKIIILPLIAIIVLLTACGEKCLPDTISCDKILDTAIGSDLKYKNTTTYIKGQNDVDEYVMSMWADGVFEEFDEYDLITDYAISYSNDNKTYEISVLKAKNSDDAKKLEKVLERRKETLCTGTKAAYDSEFDIMIKNSKIFTDANFAVFLLTDDNDTALNRIDELK